MTQPLRRPSVEESSEIKQAYKFPLQASGLTPQWQGVIWKLLACLFFASINGIVRYISGGTGQEISPLPSAVITFWQNLFGCFIILPWTLKDGLTSLKTKYLRLQTIRIASAVLGVVLWYMSLAHMTIAEAVALGFTGPIFSVIGAKLYLNERLGIIRLIGVSVGFIGAFIILRPDQALWGSQATYQWYVFLPLFSAIAIAVSKLASRKLGSYGESPKVMTLTLLFFMSPCALVPALFEWIWPTFQQFLWLGLLGLFSMAAHYSTAKAYQLAEVVFLTPFGFARLLFSALIGFIAFAEIPTSQSLWIGAAIIVVSSILLSYEEKKSKSFIRPTS
ncbi:hypothetical protein IM40_07675 [Candidatus Paracaedimonas acanthamoebae]|nr:hypothetical protein IM40_07675 [Candidatus Paracaedimonas acanthamoebae]